jgi:hypothetical protein
VIDLPLVIDKKRTTNLGGGLSSTSLTTNIGIDISKQSLADVQNLLRGIALEELARQERLGNRFSRIFVDNQEGKNILQAQRLIVATFGNRLEAIAMRVVESELSRAIAMTTQVRTGKLRDIRGSWEWVYFANRNDTGKPVTADLIASMPAGSFIVLRPKIEYVGWVNMHVKNSGKGSITKTIRRGENKGTKKVSNVGFMALATNRITKKKLFKSFSLWAGFSTQFTASGDKYPYGSPYIAIRSKRVIKK